MFQFPSNGKVYPKTASAGTPRGNPKFQFPSNGKVYPKLALLLFPVNKRYSFNSLQTGKYIQSNAHNAWKSDLSGSVSIPFKRESISKESGKMETSKSPIQYVSIPFKRESISKVGSLGWRAIAYSVSIPFKRESISKGFSGGCSSVLEAAVSIPFKRESISKVNVSPMSAQKHEAVSIPFKRESISKVGRFGRKKIWTPSCFNSLQTGKYIQRELNARIQAIRELEVSIPFKRESISKGKSPTLGIRRIKFQFPSNGKVYPKV